MRYLPITLVLLVFALLPFTNASYVVTSINTTVTLNLNTSASVVEIYKMSLSNLSVGQYTNDRLALNFTVSQWENIVGPQLFVHIINPRGSVYNFNFVPGPIQASNNGNIAYLILSYTASNITSVNQTAPRSFTYKFNADALNFQNAKSGAVLGLNNTLSVILPQSSRILSVFPNPDYPPYGFAKSYRNVTSLKWGSDESLSTFTLEYTVQESLQEEVLDFFTGVYSYLGGFTYVIIIIAVAALIVYTYLKVGK